MAVLRLRAASPVFVLGGGSVVVGLDAFYKDGRLYLVDLSRGDLLSAVRGELNLESVIKLAGSDPARFAYAVYPSPQLPERAEVRLGTAPPASSVKGLLRTAYLWRVLSRDGEAAGRFLKAVREAVAEGVHPKYVAAAGEAAVFKRHFPGGRALDVFNLVSVVERGAEVRFRVFRVDVLEGSAAKASFYAVGADRDSVFEYVVETRPLVSESGKSEVVVTVDDLKEALDMFAGEVAKFEESRGLRPPCRGAVRLGFGAGRRWKTILTLVERLDKSLFAEVEEYMARRLGRPWGDRTVKVAEGAPVGWVCYEWR
ncbi:CRISPR-associated protein [Pyrobaculum sp.]|uniref:CRISPR-associated protein n=1 Tax=Pyrobaculum sp. TaxID=2004705 RepID=UPI003D0CFE16